VIDRRETLLDFVVYKYEYIAGIYIIIYVYIRCTYRYMMYIGTYRCMVRWGGGHGEKVIKYNGAEERD